MTAGAIVVSGHAGMADRIANLKHYAHPPRNRAREGEGSPADMRADRAGMKRTGMTMKQWESSPQDAVQDARKPPARAPKASAPDSGGAPRDAKEPSKPAAPRTRTDTPLSAEQRFYRSATPAPVKGIR